MKNIIAFIQAQSTESMQAIQAAYQLHIISAL